MRGLRKINSACAYPISSRAPEYTLLHPTCGIWRRRAMPSFPFCSPPGRCFRPIPDRFLYLLHPSSVSTSSILHWTVSPFTNTIAYRTSLTSTAPFKHPSSVHLFPSTESCLLRPRTVRGRSCTSRRLILTRTPAPNSTCLQSNRVVSDVNSTAE
jgi:hypothetical protein